MTVLYLYGKIQIYIFYLRTGELKMGWFSSKPKKPVIDLAQSNANKKRFREIFNEVVEDGDSYKVFHASSTTSSYDSGFVFNTTTYTFFDYVVGYRESDYQVVVIQINAEMTEHGKPFFITTDDVIGTDYDRKIHQACLIYAKHVGGYGMFMDITDNSAKSLSIPNLDQEEERERFLDFLEKYTEKLIERGLKFRKWKR